MSDAIVEAGKFIDQCITALGGSTALYEVVSLYVQLERCVWMAEAEPATLRVDIYRAQGGRIRFEEYLSERERNVTIINGLSGARQREQQDDEGNFKRVDHIELDALDIEEIKRSVRLYPRNFLAHADEHQYKFNGLQQLEHERVYALDLLVEEVTYYFHDQSLLCLRMIDRRTDSITNYEDYQEVSGILTPFIERTSQAGRNFRADTIKVLEYNRELSDELFDTGV